VLGKILRFIFGTRNQRTLKRFNQIVFNVNEKEEGIAVLSDSELYEYTAKLKTRFLQGESLEVMLPEAFALVREASKRTLQQRHYDVQIIGGAALFYGNIAEMKTGEGKTLTATLPLYLHSISGSGAHLVTVNDYLAHRDAEWMRPLYGMLGMTVGSLSNGMFDSERKKIYASDIVYGTNSEFGFDYLRDNMKYNLSDYVQRGLNFAIVDEVDSILIDESRTPLIISGATSESFVDEYKKVDSVVRGLKRDLHYEVDAKERQVYFTELGIDEIEAFLGIKNLYNIENCRLLHHVQQALRAHVIFKRDFDYIVRDDEIFIVDEFTGRIMHGRRYSDGLHQALEAKERVSIQEESQTLASITLQNYFRLYKRLSGMTGTALTESEEFYRIYNLDVIAIPTNQPMQRMDKEDFIFLTENAKFKHIVDDVKTRYEKGQPVLIGTVAVETSERLSIALQKNDIPHVVLNAKQHEREAEIIAHAGEKGKITIATNMAGRGTDIRLIDQTRSLGGLYVLGTERHESRRIDNQLRGRSGRQGDPGESRFYISLEDDLIRRFAGDSLKNWMRRTGMTEDEVIEDSLVSKTIEGAQEKVEKHNFEVRKHLIEYDDVLNKQRMIVYFLRRLVIDDCQKVFEVVADFIEKFSLYIVNSQVSDDTELIDAFMQHNIFDECKRVLKDDGVSFQVMEGKISRASLLVYLSNTINTAYFLLVEKASVVFFEHCKSMEDKKITMDSRDMVLQIHKMIILEKLDELWRRHIVNLEIIREGIGLRGYGQKTPIIEYKDEAFRLFSTMIRILTYEVIENLFTSRPDAINIDVIEERRRDEMKNIEEDLKRRHKEKEGEESSKLMTNKIDKKRRRR